MYCNTACVNSNRPRPPHPEYSQGLLTKGKRKKRGGRGRWRMGFSDTLAPPPAQMLPCRVNGINANFGYKFPQYTIFHLCRLLHRYHQRRKKPLWLRMSPFHIAMTLDTKERAEWKAVWEHWPRPESGEKRLDFFICGAADRSGREKALFLLVSLLFLEWDRFLVSHVQCLGC